MVALRPKNFNVYHEPFLGGGALFFALYRANLLRQKFPAAVLSDIDPGVVDSFLAVRKNPGVVAKILDTFPRTESFHRSICALPDAAFTRAGRAARFIYLAKTAFGALVERITEDGQYDPTHFTHVGCPERFYRIENLLAAARALRQAVILRADYRTVLTRAKPGDWVYFDPPYDKCDPDLYSAPTFTTQDHIELAETFQKLSDAGVHVMLTNSDTKLVRDLYRKYYITKWQTRNCISWSGKNPVMGELVVTSYRP